MSLLAEGAPVAVDTTQTGTPDVVTMGVPDTAPIEGADTDSWHSSLNPDIVTDKVRGFKSVEDLVISYNNGQQLISGKGLAPPMADASDEEWAAWHNKTRPESSDQYDWQPPEELAESWDGEDHAAAREALFEAGLDKKQFAGVMDTFLGWTERQTQAIEQRAEESKTEAIKQLTEDWGAKSSDNIRQAAAFASKHGIDQILNEARLPDGSLLGSNPAVLKALHAAAVSSGEPSIAGVEGVVSRGNAQQRFVEAGKKLMNMRPDHPDYQRLNTERNELGAQLYKS